VGRSALRALPAAGRAAGTPGRRLFSEQLGYPRRRPACPIRLDRPVVDLAPELLHERLGDHIGGGRVVVHAPTRAVATQAVMDVHLLLEVMLEGEVQERPPAGVDQRRSRSARARRTRQPLAPALELGTLDRVGAERDRTLVCARRAGIVAGAAQQLGVCGVQRLIALEACVVE